MNNYHLVADKEDWSLKAERSDVVILTHPNKLSLIAQLHDFFEGRNEKASVKIHTRNGEIEEERTYPRSADPSKSKG
jgi:Uncharacterized protein conserved in bacteria (DUF2188)